MTRYIIFNLILCSSIFGFSQERDPRAQIEAAKIALITERLALTPDQAEKFWPIYHEYSRKQEQIRQEFNQVKSRYNPQSASEDENKQLLELGYKTKERTIDLERQYSDRLLQVINNRQLLSLRKAETDFKSMILNRLRDQQQKRQQMQERQQGNQDIQKRRNE